MDTTESVRPSVGRALGAIADTAIDQARDLVVGHLDRWAGGLHERLAATSTQPASPPASNVSPLIAGVLAGALAGAVAAWLLVGRRPEE